MERLKIPVLDLTPEVEELWEDLQAAIARVLRSGQFILGPEVEAFEREVAEYLGVKHAIGVNSGTDALVLSLRALGIGPGDEVITTPFTFFATAEAVHLVGATPVYVDIDPESFNLDPKRIEEAITPRTRAILPVHLYGRPAEMDAILAVARAYGLKVIEDTAQAFGAVVGGRKAGTLGDVGAFSFFPSKNLGAYGDGGLVVTDDDEVAERVRMLRAHGSRTKYFNEVIGYNSRLDALQAAILRVKLPHIDHWNAARRLVARRYNALLEGVPGIVIPDVQEGYVFHQYTIRVLDGKRDAVRRFLADRGIATMVYYPVPLHRLPVYSTPPGEFPEAERAASEVLSLPIWPKLPPAVLHEVAYAVREAVGAQK